MVFDVAVVGMGAMGAATLYELARGGARVVGIDRFEPGHSMGSSHGRTRVIRLAYFENPSYVPLVRRAYSLWQDLERTSGETLLHVIGMTEIGQPDGRLISGTLAASRLHDLPHQVMDARALTRRYPAFCLPSDFVAVIQPDAGYLEAARALHVYARLANNAGAELRWREHVLAVEPRGDGVRIVTDRGCIEAATAIITAGPWVKEVLPTLPVPLLITRQAVMFVDPPDGNLYAPERFPMFLLESAEGKHYGFPWNVEEGLKLAEHNTTAAGIDPNSYDRQVSPVDEERLRRFCAKYLPGLAACNVRSRVVCLYTMTPDEDFILDRLPGNEQVVVASPCSGHGFKFAPVIGEILADLALRGETSVDISRFRIARFS